MEIWKDIKGYEGLYQVSDKGNVRSLDRVLDNGRKYPGKILLQNENNCGYFRVTLSKCGKTKRFFVHRLVAQVFIPNPENKPTVNHIDEFAKHNNGIDNLCWMTVEENSNYGTRNKRTGEGVKKAQSMPIFGINKDNGLILEFDSFSEASKNGFNLGNLYQCVIGKNKHHKGFRWYKK